MLSRFRSSLDNGLKGIEPLSRFINFEKILTYRKYFVVYLVLLHSFPLFF